MATLTLADAFAQFGAKPSHRLRSQSAIAEDGALVLSCLVGQFHRHVPGVLRYEDTLSRDAEAYGTSALREHLALARDGELPVRMVVVTTVGGRVGRNIHVRTDLVGKITKFDGDHFIVDFTRIPVPAVAKHRA